MNLDATWTDGNGTARTTTVATAPGSPGRPVAVLLHGASGTAADMVSPLTGPHGNELYDAQSPVPKLVDRGWHDYPNVGWWSLGALDAKATGRGWQAVLEASGYPTAVYSQTDPTGLLADPTRELHAVMNVVRQAWPGRGYVFVADSRAGLLARRWLADLDPSSAERADLRAVVTLHTPHLGTGLATQANTVAAALDQVAATVPSVASVARQLSSEIRSPDLIEMAPGSSFLNTLTVDEQARGIPGAVRMFTWGGTSPRLVRARNWAFTADSAAPHVISIIPPKVSFHWQTVPQELIALADGVAALGAIAPEFRDGIGDLLVTDPNTRLPWSTAHTSNHMSHADTLVNPVLQQQVVNTLASVPA